MAANKSKVAASSNGEAASARTDGDALRAARLEGADQHTFRLFDEDWDLVPEIPFAFGEVWQESPRKAVAMLFSDHEAADRFLDQGPSDPDVAALIRTYGTNSGK